MKISIIVPIYKVERYLAECIESVLKQSYQNLELILVDDGSPDQSHAICDEYAKKDSRIIVIHKKNGGLSDARNCGIQRATGDYTIFLDGDDYWDDSNALEKLVKRVKKTNADVLNYSYKKYYEDTGEIIPYFKDLESMPLEITSKTEQLEYLTKKSLYIASACNKMIRTSLFRRNLLFKKGVFSEDIEWCARLLVEADSFDFICENFYCYRQRKDSIRHTISDRKCTDLKNNIIHSIEIANAVCTEWKDSFYRYSAFQFATFFMVQAQAEYKQRDNIEKLKGYSWILKYYADNKKVKYLYYICKVIGYKKLCSIIRFVYHR